MSWFWLASAAAVCSAVNVWSSKLVVSKDVEPVLIGAVVHLLAGLLALLALPFVEIRIDLHLPILLGMVAMVAVYTIGNVLYFRSLSQTPLSEIDLYLRTSSLWTLLGGVLFLNENFSGLGVLGAALVIGSVLVMSKQRRLGKIHHPQLLALGAAIMFGLGNVVDKALSPHFSTTAYTALNMAFTGLGMLCFVRARSQILRPEFRGGGAWLIAVTFAATQFFLVLAYQSGGGAGSVILVAQARLLLLMVVGIGLLHEREHLGRKVTAATLMLGGIFLLYGM